MLDPYCIPHSSGEKRLLYAQTCNTCGPSPNVSIDTVSQTDSVVALWRWWATAASWTSLSDLMHALLVENDRSYIWYKIMIWGLDSKTEKRTSHIWRCYTSNICADPRIFETPISDLKAMCAIGRSLTHIILYHANQFQITADVIGILLLHVNAL